MSTGDERLDAVEDRIDEAKEAADRVEDNEGLGLRHRERDQHGTFEPSGDDRNAGKNPSQGRDNELRSRLRIHTPPLYTLMESEPATTRATMTAMSGATACNASASAGSR